MFVLYLFLVLALVSIVQQLWKHSRYYYLGFQIPGVAEEFPLIGSAHCFIGSLEKAKRVGLELYAQTRGRTETVYRLWMGPMLCVFLTDADDIHQLLINHLNKAKIYSILGGHGLLEQQSLPKWAKHRKIMSPSFHYPLLKSYVQVFHEEAHILANKMAPYAESHEAFDPDVFVVLGTMASFVRSIYGVDLEIQQNHWDKHPYLLAVDSFFQIFMKRCKNPLLLVPIVYKLSGYQASVQKLRVIKKEFMQIIIRNMKHRIAKGNDISSLTSPEDKAELLRKLPFAERILIQKVDPEMFHMDTMNDKDLSVEMIGLANAGLETLRNTTAIAMNMLAIHQDVQKEVYDEIHNVFGDDVESTPSYEQLLKLHTLNRVIKEVLRMYPTAPIIARSSTQDLQLGGCTIPAGATIVSFIYGVHRDPKYWSNPDQFDPDRFLPSQCERRNPYAYLPFSLGARNCIGSKFAMLYMVTTLSTLLRRYRLLPGDKCRSVGDIIRFEFGLTLRLLPGNDVRLESRRLKQ